MPVAQGSMWTIALTLSFAAGAVIDCIVTTMLRMSVPLVVASAVTRISIIVAAPGMRSNLYVPALTLPVISVVPAMKTTWYLSEPVRVETARNLSQSGPSFWNLIQKDFVVPGASD